MRWGVRKSNPSGDSNSVRKIRKKKVNEMTNQELREANNRLQLERQYKDLTKKKNVGKQALNAFIGTAGTISAVVGAVATYKKLGDKAIDKIGDWVIKDIKW